MQTRITLLLVLLAVSLRSLAQVGSITGKVTDRSNHAVVALVSLWDNGKVKYSTTTSVSGDYTFQQVKPGKYEVTATAPHYIAASKKNVAINNGRQTRVDFKLEAVTITQPEVVAPAPTHRHKHKNQKDYADEKMFMGSGAVMSKSMVIGESYNKPVYFNPSTESYKKNPENDFMNVKVNPLSTMSVDVDRASYSNVRRFINQGQRPPADAVRVEEMINYFDYDYSQPKGEDPILISTELVDCPWQKDHKLLRIGMQAKKVNTEKLPPSNLVFLIDVSGSMESQDKLPLLIEGMKLLVQNLRAQDKVAIVTYAGNAGLVLPPTDGEHKQTILDALNRLTAGGSTAGGAGIKLAYKVAQDNFIKGGNNRAILATDGDFNVGVSNENELEDLITKQRETGVFLTCLGFGTGNYKDSKMELLADKGNGNYDYVDNIQEAQKVLVSEFGGTLFTIAKDVKAQIEFNPSKVQGYRLVGYENRVLNNEDFKDDKKDAGDMGSGHTVTIMYEIIPVGVNSTYMRDASDLKYQQPKGTSESYSNELATIKFRYKQPDGDKSKEMVHTIADRTIPVASASENTRFAASVAMFGMLLKDSKYKGSSTYSEVIAMASNARTHDKEGYRAEFIRLAKAAKEYKSTASVE
ncbi:MAG: hypothetical protein K0Q79_1237 [Flavipsychrobacter sp.]|jgi:Ca-activated chloride channel family protein|nr:hypothetical protein [Flavipsychrobacter sp.]